MAKLHGGTFLPGTLAEWTGVFVFSVGVYGATFRPVTRHYTLYGVVPLDWFYFGLLAGGAILMLFGGPPHRPSPDATRWTWLWVGLRGAVTAAMLAALGWWAIAR